MEDAVLSGLVDVKDALYSAAFNAGGGLFDFGRARTTRPGAGAAASRHVAGALRHPHHRAVDAAGREQDAAARRQRRPAAARDLSNAPCSSDSAEIVRGEALYEGKRFLITRGTVDFNNPTRIEPFFDIEAETRIRVPQETYRVTLRVTGPLDGTPNFSFDPIRRSPNRDPRRWSSATWRQAPTSSCGSSTRHTPQARTFRERAARALTGVAVVRGQPRRRGNVWRRYVPDHAVAAGSQHAVVATRAGHAGDGAQTAVRSRVR